MGGYFNITHLALECFPFCRNTQGLRHFNNFVESTNLMVYGKVLSDPRKNYEVSMKLLCDDKTAISIANISVQHDRTKHVKIDRHLIKREIVQW